MTGPVPGHYLFSEGPGAKGSTKGRKGDFLDGVDAAISVLFRLVLTHGPPPFLSSQTDEVRDELCTSDGSWLKVTARVGPALLVAALALAAEVPIAIHFSCTRCPHP